MGNRVKIKSAWIILGAFVWLIAGVGVAVEQVRGRVHLREDRHRPGQPDEVRRLPAGRHRRTEGLDRRQEGDADHRHHALRGQLQERARAGRQAVPLSHSGHENLGPKETAGKTEQEFVQLLGPDKSKLIVIYCGFVKCTRSHNGAMWAVKNGYTNVYRHPGGVFAWKGAKYPTAAVK